MEQQQQIVDPVIVNGATNEEADAKSATSANDALDTEPAREAASENPAPAARPPANVRNRTRNLTRAELEALRARLQKQFH